MAVDFEAVSKAFVEHYYNLFDTNRPALSGLYQDTSMLTFEGQKIMGTQAIAQKLVSLPFTQCKHAVSTVDSQPSSQGIVVFVSGQLMVEGEVHPLKFSQVFHLMPAGGSYYVLNDMFRLNYA